MLGNNGYLAEYICGTHKMFEFSIPLDFVLKFTMHLHKLTFYIRRLFFPSPVYPTSLSFVMTYIVFIPK